MEFVFRSRFLHFVVAVRDFDKDEPDEDLIFVSNTGGDFVPLPSDDDEPDSGTCTEPLDLGFGFRSTVRGFDG